MTSVFRSAPLALRGAVLVGVLGTLGCQQLENDLDQGSGSGVDAGTLGSVCCGGNGSCADGLDCCAAEGEACTGDYDCCGGLCSGGTSSDGITSGSGTCVASQNLDCSAALGSRCTSVASCACQSDTDCCQNETGASCTNSSVTTAGKRCCLAPGIPCGGDGDCCSGSCDSSTLACD